MRTHSSSSRRGHAKLGFALALVIAAAAQAQQSPLDSAMVPDQGKLPLTAGFSDIDGAGGGGLVPWALITGYGTADSWGANAHVTEVPLRDFRLLSYGVAVAALDRVEVSVAQDEFEARSPPLNGLSVAERIYGLKVRLSGDAVYDQDSWAPQTAIGVEYKKNSGISDFSGLVSPRQLGATGTSGTDWYLSATKLFLAQSVLINVTLRDTAANELGLLGFGGDLKSGRSVEFESTVAYIVRRTVAVGAEFRERPHNLGVDDEHAAWDVFAAWTLNRHVSLVGAYVNLGSILGAVTSQTRAQMGAYVSLQVGF